MLSDGTSVQLNADSKIQFPVAFNGRTREVSISGEAYLNVAEDEQRPFVVHLPNSTIQVLGTEFNVNTYSNDKVALVKGAVKLSINNTSVLIKPGYAASYSIEKGIQTGPFNEEELLAWKTRLEARGVVVSAETAHEVIESIYFRDPNGYFIEITRKLRPLAALDARDADATLAAAIELEDEARATQARVTSIDDIWVRKAELLGRRLNLDQECHA